MRQFLSRVAILVREYDEAIRYYTGVLGFTLLEDTRMSAEKRWVVVGPPGARETGLRLARAATDDQRAAIGRQTGGRVFLFLRTDDFERDYAEYCRRGVAFVEAPRDEPYGRVAVFEDLYGNRWDLIGRAP